jgi:predicted MFS family arabinose efflux permease
MAVTTVNAPPVKASWVRVALAMFAVGWGANQFSPMLIVYRHELGLGPGAVAGLFAIYAATLIPGLLIGGPASDRFGRRAVVLPFVALSPLATLLLVLGSGSLPLVAAGRALAGVCSGVVFGAATAWVQELSHGSGLSARRAALALTAGFGLGPVVAAVLAQWVRDPLVVPYLPHLAIGVAAAVILWRVPATPVQHAAANRRWPPAAVRTLRFWLTVALPAPVVFGSLSVAIVVLPEEVTSAHTLSVGFAGLMTALAFGAGVAVQPLARRLETRRRHAAVAGGLGCAAAGAAVSIPAVASADHVLAGTGAVLLGLAYGLCLVSGLRQAEHLAGAHDRGAVVACYFALSYVGFAAPYAVDGLNSLLGRAGTFAALAGAAAALTAWMGWQAMRSLSPEAAGDTTLRSADKYVRSGPEPAACAPTSAATGCGPGLRDVP